MALTKRPNTKPALDAEKFIAGAPDAGAAHQAEPIEQAKAKREQISLTIDPALLAKVDAWAKRKGMSRAAAFAFAAASLVEQ